MTEFPARHEAGDPPRSRAVTRAIASHPAAMDDIMSILGGRVSDVHNLVGLMAEASRTAVRYLPGVDWAGVTTQLGDTPSTASHTDARVLMIDEMQYDVQDGPCLRAMRGDALTSMVAAEVTAAWPALGRTARKVGVRSFLAAPLHARMVSVGAINLYSGQAELRDAEPDLLQVIVDYLERGLDDYLDAHPGEDPRDVRQAVAGWGRVEQAVGVMMSTYGFSAEYAHALLEDHAKAGSRGVINEAKRVIDSSSGAPT